MKELNKLLQRPLKVFLPCTGVGIINRGIETFARECFHGLHGQEGLHIELFKGKGVEGEDEHQLWNLPRTGSAAHLVGKIINRNSYVVEQLSFFLPFVKAIRKEKPDIIYYSDSNLGFQLYRWRKSIGIPYKLLFSNGGPCRPPFDRTDYVQQVAPYYRDIALQAGEHDQKHFMVPYGIFVPTGNPLINPDQKHSLRRKLNLPLDKKIVISVGWISAYHKRMDYTIQEIAALPNPKPHLVMLGHIDENSHKIIQLAEERLGISGFTALSLPYERVVEYYQASDIFVLSSLQEGFGRVYLEALMQGLPCIVHNHPVMNYVLGPMGIFANLAETGNLTQSLKELLNQENEPVICIRRREYVRKKFGWPALANKYMDMFRSTLTSVW